MKTLVTASLFILASLLLAHAETTTPLQKCAAVKDEKARLACFDQLARQEVPEPPNSGDILSLADVQTDAKELKGKKITVKGFALVAGQQAYLYSERGSMDGIVLSLDGLQRDQRLAFFEQCTSGCDVTVTGKVKDAFGMIQLALTNASVE